jgi:hypothetical protein
MTAVDLTPIEVSIAVPWSQEDAFRRFVEDFEKWWPKVTHSIGGPRVKRIVFEGQMGGRIYEEHEDGRRFQWGQVLVWGPPGQVKFTFHPSRDPSTAQEVELRFVPEGTGTRLTLTAQGWDKWGRGAHRARRGYKIGWGYVLNVWAGRRTLGMRVMSAIGSAATMMQLVLHGGRKGLINAAGGEIS